MTAALVTKITNKEITGNLGMEFARCYITTTGDWYVSKFGTIVACFVSDETTAGGACATWSGSKVTITATAADYVDLLIVGY